MTEEEAKTKWCPMVRHYHYTNDDVPVSGYNSYDGQNRGNCIGSACMMWRKVGYDKQTDGGYCGLAGKP